MIILYYLLLVVILSLPFIHYWRTKSTWLKKEAEEERMKQVEADAAKLYLSSGYSKEVIAEGEARMKDIQTGKIQKHLLTNDSDEYDSKAELLSFQKFVKGNSLQRKLETIKDIRFNG